MTGGRLKRLSKYLSKDTFMLTYGDGLSNVNLKRLLKFHKKNKKLISLTAVRPPSRFGGLKIKGNYVNYFKSSMYFICAAASLHFNDKLYGWGHSIQHLLYTPYAHHIIMSTRH